MSQLSFSKDGLELLLNLSKILKDIPMFLNLKTKEIPNSQFKFWEIKKLMKISKLKVMTIMEFSEKIHNSPMEQVLHQPLMLSISDYQDIIFIIPKLMLTLLFLVLLVSITSNLHLELPLVVSLSLMTKLITGLYVQLMDPLLLTGFAPFLKFLDYHAPKKEKLLKFKLKKFRLLNHY